MERRAFLKKASVAGLAAGTLAAPAIAAAEPQIRWRLASSFPKSLDTIYGGAEDLANRVREMTDGKFDIRVFAGGEIVPGLQVLDAVSNGTVEIGHSCSYYYVGKNKAFAFDTSLPFGLTAREQNAWMYYGGGEKLMAELFDQYKILALPGGNTGAQMGGWFRKPITSLADLKGLKMRIPGIGGEIMARLGAVPQTLSGGDIYPSLEKGTIDAAEWVGPYDDEKLGFYKIAKYYYYPGFWEPGPQVSFYIGKEAWARLPKAYQAALRCAAAETNVKMLADYDAKNPAALARLLKQGVKLQKYPDDVLKGAFKASEELYAEESAKNPLFKKIYASWAPFRNNEARWMSIAEAPLERFMQANPLKVK
ncbi:TRAP transporter substrate-binding protein [Laribacter hongkongensis]|uniref:TRAP transporter substrate-binding protein n=1 Tax=Laribacter hongkongensis TaxID=168471 RepID=UPI001EFD49DF|nr:TRAP transporter substrate-binding protein [Laribacter hongkongensis]MCG8995178.1 TRAP transporter substrate-binding protein [Laribacter hongkongensis]MCG9009860.1 TRAP transporter substrate-binding protein [Laribacter hongkongensis]MCG9023719.1 TRAP transporter substrate-binding protein [Laribacter hongkongensis]MCG9047252.1 TRAP transporter substrate-binding protein [Laribacter hongkongensis]MCG9073612.1 TRAP transporter substrate-binding protein [Laribacter hongkongensis]